METHLPTDRLINVENLNFNRHLLCQTSQDIQEIMQPITPFGIKQLCYQRIDKDEGMVIFTNLGILEELFITEKIYLDSLSAPYDHYSSGFYLGDFANLDLKHTEILQAYNIWHHLILVQRNLNNTEIFYFGADINNSNINHFYLNNLDLFKKFTLLFKEKSTLLVKQYQSQRLFYPQGKDDSVLTKASTMPINQDSDIQLTNREQECWQYLKQGYSAKMIANHLSISPRTVEHHLAHIREKLNTSSIRTALISFKH